MLATRLDPKLQSRAWLLTIAVGGIAWLGGSRFGGNSAGRSAPIDTVGTQQREAAAPAVPMPQSHRGLDLLRAFAGAAPLRPDSVSAWPGYTLDVLIGSFPDPYDSHLDWAFDSQLEAARRAFETTDFVVDRFWLPGPDSVTIGTGTTQLKLARRELEPGVLLFRRQRNDSVDLRLLYVVGELPTSGIHRGALITALQERRWLLDSLARPRTHRLRIVGPTFSGSSLSLRQVLEDTRRNGLSRDDTVSIVTGSASSYTNRATLTSTAGPVLQFSATVHPNESMTAALRSAVLGPMGIPDRRVALLQESSTQYGLTTVDTSDAGSFLVVPFPMSISSLRAEYLRNPTTEAAPPGPSISTAAPRLPLNLLDARRPREDIALTSQLSPATLDLVVDEIVRTLADHRIRVVGLLFTDVRDKLVLGAELRRRMRDVQLFTYESNMLYVRSDQNTAMRGMLVLSSYSLATQTQWWSQPMRSQRLSFPSDAAEGVFNATVLQLENPRALVDYRPPLKANAANQPPIWISTVGRGAFLPLAAVEDQFLSPCYLAAVPPASAPPTCPNPSVAGQSPAGPDLRAMGILPFLTVTIAMAFLLFLAWIAWSLDDPPSGRAPVLDNPIDEAAAAELRPGLITASLDIHRGLYASLAGSDLICMFLYAAGLRFRLAMAPGGEVPVWLGVALLAVAAALVPLGRAAWSVARLVRDNLNAGIRYGFKLQWGDWRKRLLWRAEVTGRIVVAIFGVGFAGLTLMFLWNIWRLGDTGAVRFQLYFHRAADVGSLASPILPPILAGIGYAVWCAWHLWRVLMLQRRPLFEQLCEQERLKDDSARTGFDQLGAAVSDFRWRLFLVVPTMGAFGLLVILAMAFGWLFGQFGGSMEAISRGGQGAGLTTFDWLLRGCIGAALFSIAWATCRFLTVWSAFDRALEAAQLMPLGAALDRLPNGVAGLTRLRLPRVGEDRLAGQLANQQLMRLEALNSEVVGSAGPAAPAAVDLQLVYRALRRAWAEAIWTDGADKPKPPGPWVTAAEDLLAVHLVIYLEWATQHLRVLALFLLLSLVLTILLLSGYPFYPKHLVTLCFIAVLLAAVGAVLYVNVRMSRDETLSRIAKTTPGKISWNANFIGNLVTFGLVPLLTLLGSEFPQIRNALFSWAKPLLDVLAKP